MYHFIKLSNQNKPLIENSECRVVETANNAFRFYTDTVVIRNAEIPYRLKSSYTDIPFRLCSVTLIFRYAYVPLRWYSVTLMFRYAYVPLRLKYPVTITSRYAFSPLRLYQTSTHATSIHNLCNSETRAAGRDCLPV